VHSIWPEGDKGVRALAVAVGWQEPKGEGHIPHPLREFLSPTDLADELLNVSAP